MILSRIWFISTSLLIKLDARKKFTFCFYCETIAQIIIEVMIEVHMAKDSILMHYLDSLVSADAKEKLGGSVVGGRFFVVNQEENDTLDIILQKKIAVIKKTRDLQVGDAKIAASFLLPFVDNYLNLRRAQIVALQSYKAKIAKGLQEPDPNVLLEIADKMILTALLQAAVYRDSYGYLEQLRTLEQLLYDLSSDWSAKEKPIIAKPINSGLSLYDKNIPKPNEFIASYSENFHVPATNVRFVFARTWRLLVAQFTRAFAYLTDVIKWIRILQDNHVGDFFAYLAWVFFIPRILINLCTLIFSAIGTLSIFGGKKLPEIEKEYGWLVRLKIRIKELFFEIANDWMWFVSGLINCFSLAGNLPIIGVYIMVAAQAYDFCMIMIRNYLDSKRLNKFKNDLQKIKDDNDLDDNGSFIANFSNRIEIDKKALLYAIFNFAVLLICIALMTQAFGTISPFIPLVASFITIIVAPLRHYSIGLARSEANKLNPPLIAKDSYGALVIENESELRKPNLLGRYSKGVICIKKGENEIAALYEYNRGVKQQLENNANSQDRVAVINDLSLFSRVKTVDKTFIKSLGVKLDDSAKEQSGTTSWMKSISSMYSSGG